MGDLNDKMKNYIKTLIVNLNGDGLNIENFDKIDKSLDKLEMLGYLDKPKQFILDEMDKKEFLNEEDKEKLRIGEEVLRVTHNKK